MALVDAYAGVVCDVDGVLCRGAEPVPGAGETLRALEKRGVGVVLVTNNARRTPDELAAHLRDMGIPAAAGQIITSASAAATLLDPGDRCLVIGMAGLRQALRDRGCVLVDDPVQADAVVVGFDMGLRWDDLRRATLALGRGARFVGTNADATFPAPEGLWPGNGAILAALEAATGRAPEVAGKPAPALFEAAAAQLPPGRLLMVGDRVETDIAGAARLGWDSALVLSGVTSPDRASQATPNPTYVLESVIGLLDEASHMAKKFVR